MGQGWGRDGAGMGQGRGRDGAGTEGGSSSSGSSTLVLGVIHAAGPR
jgi:hypothetical protein